MLENLLLIDFFVGLGLAAAYLLWTTVEDLRYNGQFPYQYGISRPDFWFVIIVLLVPLLNVAFLLKTVVQLMRDLRNGKWRSGSTDFGA